MRNNELTQDTKEVLEEIGSPYKLPDNALVILFHQAAHFFFILLNEGDNPPVYYGTFVENVQIQEYAPSFSTCIELWIESHIRWEEEHKQRMARKPICISLARGKADMALQKQLETVEGALQEIKEKLEHLGQPEWMEVIAQSKAWANQGKLVGLEALLVRYAPLPEEQLLAKLQILQRSNQRLLGCNEV